MTEPDACTILAQIFDGSFKPVRYKKENLVWVTLEYDPAKPEDLRLMDDFFDFLTKEKLFSLHTAQVGGGSFSAGFGKNAVRRILNWLKQRGVEASD